MARKVLSVSVPSREHLARQTRRFGREGTETFQNSSAATLREEGLSVPEIARSLGITERKVKAQLAA
jgi:DNA-binding NarL/FixJ family response regulator